jgi:hypothetical protein
MEFPAYPLTFRIAGDLDSGDCTLFATDESGETRKVGDALTAEQMSQLRAWRDDQVQSGRFVRDRGHTADAVYIRNRPSSALKGRTMSQEDFERFRDELRLFAGTFHAKNTPLPGDRVRLTECRIELNPDEEVQAKGDRGKYDVAGTWRDILDICKRHGFEP